MPLGQLTPPVISPSQSPSRGHHIPRHAAIIYPVRRPSYTPSHAPSHASSHSPSQSPSHAPPHGPSHGPYHFTCPVAFLLSHNTIHTMINALYCNNYTGNESSTCRLLCANDICALMGWLENASEDDVHNWLHKFGDVNAPFVSSVDNMREADPRKRCICYLLILDVKVDEQLLSKELEKGQFVIKTSDLTKQLELMLIARLQKNHKHLHHHQK
jgi:hypothetical protein